MYNYLDGKYDTILIMDEISFSKLIEKFPMLTSEDIPYILEISLSHLSSIEEKVQLKLRKPHSIYGKIKKYHKSVKNVT